MRFDECAAAYETWAAIQEEVAMWSATGLDESGANGLRVLELGAGTGKLTKHLATRGFADMQATDLSPQMIAVGARKVPQARWELLDAWAPTCTQVDRLYSCSLLQWAPDPQGVLERWRTLMAPDGHAITTFFIRGTLQELFPPTSGLQAVTWRSADEWVAHFHEAGWRVERTDLWCKRQLFGSPLEALRSIHRTGAVDQYKTPVSLLRRALEKYGERYANERGQVPLTWKAMRVQATPRRQSSESSI